METATRAQLMMLVFTLVLPVGTAAVILFGARRLKPTATRRSGAVALALLAGMAAAWLGVAGWPGLPPTAAEGYLFWSMLAAGGLGVALDRLRYRLYSFGVRSDCAVGLP